MSKHTPGPWSRSWIYGAIRHINKNVDYDSFWFPDAGESIDSANIPNVRINLADADLIAAAPELLNVVEALLLFHCSPIWTSAKAEEWERLLHPLLGDEPFEATTKSLCDAACAALAKARGTK